MREPLDQWKQGDLINDVQLTWAGPAAADPVTHMEAGAYDWEPVAGDGLGCAWAAVVSQTCDISAAGPGRVHPFVQVCPVVKLADDDPRWTSIKAMEVVFLFPLPAHPEPGNWVIDLRLGMPVSKTLLATAEPVDAIQDPRARQHLADALARKAARPALHDVLSEDLDRSLTEFAKEIRRRKPAPSPSWLLKVDHIRALATGDPLKPKAARLFVVVNDGLAPDEAVLWSEWHVRAANLASRAGFRLFMSPVTWEDLRARDFADSTPLHLSALGLNPYR